MKRAEVYYNALISGAKKLEDAGYTYLWYEFGDEKEPPAYILRRELRIIKRVFRKNAKTALLSYFYAMHSFIDSGYDYGTLKDSSYRSKAASTIESFIETKFSDWPDHWL